MLCPNKTKQKKEEENREIDGSAGGWLVWLNPGNEGFGLTREVLFLNGTPAFPIPAALQEHQTVL